MNKLKEKIANLYLILKKSVERFPVTIISVIVLTLIYTINNGFFEIKAQTLSKITILFVVFAEGAFLVETILHDNMKKRIMPYIASALIALAITYANVNINIMKKQLPITLVDLIGRASICYVISVIVLAIYYNYKRSSKSFSEYVTSVFINMLKICLIYGILAIGSAIVAYIFIDLILEGKSYKILAVIETLIFGLYYMPSIIYAVYDVQDKKTKFAKVVIKYVLGTLVMTAFAVIYMYIIKIIVQRDMPSNQIFRILATLFVLGLPIWTMIKAFDENKAFDKINNILPFLFITFIILQIYSIGARISSNGVTESRYLCVMLIVFEVIYILVYLKNKENIGKMLLVFVLLTVISLIVPYVNMFKVSEISQINNLKIFHIKDEYTDEEKEKITGAYYYLRSSSSGDEILNKLLTKSEQNEIVNFDSTKTYKVNDTVYMRASNSITELDLEGYNKMYMIYAYNYNSDDKKIEDIFTNLEINVANKEKRNINILKNIQEYIKYEEEETLDENFEEASQIILNENQKLIITRVHVYFNRLTEVVESYNIDGYLLEK